MSSNVRGIMLQLAKEGHVFRLFGEEAADRLASFFRIYHCPAGEIVSKPGEPLKKMGIQVSGRAFPGEKILTPCGEKGGLRRHVAYRPGTMPSRITERGTTGTSTGSAGKGI